MENVGPDDRAIDYQKKPRGLCSPSKKVSLRRAAHLPEQKSDAE
jgi:hypothetical protein